MQNCAHVSNSHCTLLSDNDNAFCSEYKEYFPCLTTQSEKASLIWWTLKSAKLLAAAPLRKHVSRGRVDGLAHHVKVNDLQVRSKVGQKFCLMLKTSRLLFCSKISWTFFYKSKPLSKCVSPQIVIGGMIFIDKCWHTVDITLNSLSIFFLFSRLELSLWPSLHNSYNCVRCQTYRVRFWYGVLAAALY